MNEKKLPSGDFFVTIARKIIHCKLSFRKGAYNESLSACKYRDL